MCAVHVGQGTGALGEERGHGAGSAQGADHPVAARLLQALPWSHGFLLHLRSRPGRCACAPRRLSRPRGLALPILRFNAPRPVLRHHSRPGRLTLLIRRVFGSINLGLQRGLLTWHLSGRCTPARNGACRWRVAGCAAGHDLTEPGADALLRAAGSARPDHLWDLPAIDGQKTRG